MDDIEPKSMILILRDCYTHTCTNKITHTMHMHKGIFSMDFFFLIKNLIFQTKPAQNLSLIVLQRNFHNMNDAEIAFQICMNDLFCFGERQFTERAQARWHLIWDSEKGKWLLSPTVPMAVGVNVSLLPPLSPSVTLGVSVEVVPLWCW